MDWTMTHEFVHTAFPSLPDDNHWMEEGLATYIEPIARVQAGFLTPEKIWGDMVRDMSKGEPGPGDRGLGPDAYLGQNLLGRGNVLPGGRRRHPREDRQPQRIAGCAASHRQRWRNH